jgi:hypothetical protein
MEEDFCLKTNRSGKETDLKLISGGDMERGFGKKKHLKLEFMDSTVKNSQFLKKLVKESRTPVG